MNDVRARHDAAWADLDSSAISHAPIHDPCAGCDEIRAIKRDALTAAAGRIAALRDEALLAVDTLATQQGPTSSLALLWRAKADSYIAVLAALRAEDPEADDSPCGCGAIGVPTHTNAQHYGNLADALNAEGEK